MKDRIKNVRKLLNPFRAGDRRTARYYRSVIAPGAGYPTFDEANRDLAFRDRSTNVPPGIW
jgi:hypothetical protein